VSVNLLAGALTHKERFLRACRFEPVDHVPVWIMRQAGRYLPEYQALRAKHAFLEICKTPEVAAEVSLQPFRILGVDAIIVFSDILIVAEAMGLSLEVRDAAAVRQLRNFDPNVETKFVGDAIRAICKEAGPDVPVIGFAAAPWTLACYMIEGRTRGDVSRAKQMLHEQPQVVRDLLDQIARSTAAYLKSQIAAGAAVVQLFDTWAGELSPSEYHAFELPTIRMIFESLAGSPVAKILFAKGSSQHLESLAKSGADVLSIDWKTDLAEARSSIGAKMALQGNVDPTILLGTEADVRHAATGAVEKTGGVGHLLNLGHGILPGTPVANAKAFVEAGHAAAIQSKVVSAEAE
jgi:uroporphyrinogen decarboxylase